MQECSNTAEERIHNSKPEDTSWLCLKFQDGLAKNISKMAMKNIADRHSKITIVSKNIDAHVRQLVRKVVKYAWLEIRKQVQAAEERLDHLDHQNSLTHHNSQMPTVIRARSLIFGPRQS
jgi:hypothetical protein